MAARFPFNEIDFTGRGRRLCAGDPAMMGKVLEPYLAEAAAAGVTGLVEYSTVGVRRNLVALIEAGFEEQLLLSHDAGWYDPARADGFPEGGFRGYTALVKEFLPGLLARGIREEQVRGIPVHNPARAFAF